jgi:1,4-alpha-glucan branching enzyme
MKANRVEPQPVTFVYKPHAADRAIALVGEFNSWDPLVCPMQRVDENFEVTVELLPGQYAYKFLVDGKLRNDPRGHMKVWDGQGSVTSLARVGA